MSKIKRATMIKADYMEYIDDHEFLPDFMKKEVKEIISSQFKIMSQQIANVELTYRRTIQHMHQKEE